MAYARAAALAESCGWPDHLARAALGYGGRFAWARAGTDTALVPLLERALDAVGDGDSPARVRLLARLAPAIRDEPLRDRRVGLAEEALEMARRIGDPVTLAYALDGYWPAVEGPDTIGSTAAADELISLAQSIGNKELEYEGHDHRLHTAWALADPAAVDVELDLLGRLADDLRQPAHRWHLGSTRMVVALMEGRFEEAEELISVSLDLGRRAESWNSVVSERVGLFVLRREQGRLAELEDTIRRSVREFPALLRFQCALAHLYAELGRAEDARAALDQLVARDLAREHLDAEWLFSISLLASPCALVEDAGAATASTGCCPRTAISIRRRRSRAPSAPWPGGSACSPPCSGATTTPRGTSAPRSRRSGGWARAPGSPTPSTTWPRRSSHGGRRETSRRPTCSSPRRGARTASSVWRSGPRAPRRPVEAPQLVGTDGLAWGRRECRVHMPTPARSSSAPAPIAR